VIIRMETHRRAGDANVNSKVTQGKYPERVVKSFGSLVSSTMAAKGGFYVRDVYSYIGDRRSRAGEISGMEHTASC